MNFSVSMSVEECWSPDKFFEFLTAFDRNSMFKIGCGLPVFCRRCRKNPVNAFSFHWCETKAMLLSCEPRCIGCAIRDNLDFGYMYARGRDFAEYAACLWCQGMHILGYMGASDGRMEIMFANSVQNYLNKRNFKHFEFLPQDLPISICPLCRIDEATLVEVIKPSPCDDEFVCYTVCARCTMGGLFYTKEEFMDNVSQLWIREHSKLYMSKDNDCVVVRF